MAGGPPTSASLFTRDPGGNAAAININPTSLRTNNTSTALRISIALAAGVPRLSSFTVQAQRSAQVDRPGP